MTETCMGPFTMLAQTKHSDRNRQLSPHDPFKITAWFWARWHCRATAKLTVSFHSPMWK